jgi:uncharacterized protein
LASPAGHLHPKQENRPPTWNSDAILATLEQVFINGKFYSLFSLLFGIGFSIILFRNEAKGVNAIHLFFFWVGDILFLYALITIAITLILSPIVIDLISVLLNVSLGTGFEALAMKIDQHNGLPLNKDGYALYLYSEGVGWASLALIASPLHSKRSDS